MKRVLDSKIFIFLLGVISTLLIGVFAYSYSAKDISYQPSNSSWKVNNIKDAIDSIKTTNDTTISNLQSSNQSMQDEITSLTNQLTTLQSFSKSKSFSFISSTQTQTFNLGFRPKYISCIGTVDGTHTTVDYNADYSTDYVYKYPAQDCNVPNSNRRTLATFFTINNNGFTWNITNWNGETIYCNASS